MDLDRQRQLELEAEAEFEFEQEQKAKLGGAIQRSAPKQLPFAGGADKPLGPDYSQSIPDNFYKGVGDIPAGATSAASSIYNFIQPLDQYALGYDASGPIDTIRNAGVEKTARTVGTMAGATAGGAYLGGLGGTYGLALGGPWGAAAGGIGGGLVGAGLGALGFNMVTDSALGETKAPSQYAKDFVYGLPLDTLLGGPFMAAPVKGAVERGARTKVLKTLDENAPGWRPAVDKALPEIGPTKQFDEYKSTSEIADAPALRAIERGLPLEDLGLYQEVKQRDAARDTARLQALNAIEPSQATPGQTQAKIANYVEGDFAQQAAAADAELAAKQAAVDAELAARQREVDAAGDVVRMKTGALPPEIDTIAAGIGPRNTIQEGIEAQRGRVSQKFGEAGDAAIDPSPIAAVAEQAASTYFREVGKQPSGPLEELIAGVTREGEPVLGKNGKPLLGANDQPIMRDAPFTVKDAAALLRDATKVMDGADRQSAAVAREIKKGIEQALDIAEANGQLTPQQRAALRDARKLRKEQGDIFEGANNPNAAILKSNYSGSPALPDSAVPGAIFTPSNPRRPRGARENILRFKEAVKAAGADYTTAMEPIYRYAANTFKFALNEDGTVNTKKARQWLEQYDEALKEVPELRAQFADPVTAQAFMNEKFGSLEAYRDASTKELARTQKEAAKGLARSKAEVARGALQFWLKGVEPEIAIKNMLSGDNAGKNLRQTVDYLKSKGDKEALDGLRRGFIEYMEGITYEATKEGSKIEASRIPGGQTFNGKAYNKLFADTWDKLRTPVEKSGLMTESQLRSFEDLYYDINSQLSVKNERITNGSDTIQNNVINGLLRLSSQSFLSGHGALIRFGGSLLGMAIKNIPQAAFRKMLAEAILNPRFARDLQNAATAKNLNRTAYQIFGDALGRDATLGQNAVKAAKVAPFVLTKQGQQDPEAAPAPRKPLFTKQEAVTSKKSFPTPGELMSSKAPGQLQNRTIARDAYEVADPTKKKVNFLDGESSSMAAIDDETLDGVRWVESKNGKYLKSPAGALGEYQFMPATAKAYGVNLNDNNAADDREGARALLSDEYDALGSLELALAAYNAGRPAVIRAIKRAGSKDWDKVSKFLSEETRNYVPAVLAERQRVLAAKTKVERV